MKLTRENIAAIEALLDDHQAMEGKPLSAKYGKGAVQIVAAISVLRSLGVKAPKKPTRRLTNEDRAKGYEALRAYRAEFKAWKAEREGQQAAG